MGLRLHILAPGYSSPRLPKLFPASECFFFCLSHFLFSGSFQLPVSPAHPTLTDLQLFFLVVATALGQIQAYFPVFGPLSGGFAVSLDRKQQELFVKKIFEALMQGLGWVGTKESSWGIRNQEVGHMKQSMLPFGLMYQLWRAPNNCRMLILLLLQN